MWVVIVVDTDDVTADMECLLQNRGSRPVAQLPPAFAQALLPRLQDHFSSRQLDRAQRPTVDMPYHLDRARRYLYAPNGDATALTAAEGIVLDRLARAAPDPVSRRELTESLGHDVRYYDERRLEATVSRLRRKLKSPDAPPNSIKAARGRGYQLLIDVAVV
ncbi:winged helix-turn-helix domain-containing protein [Arhodomonas sp. AD133]|uniref:winged helix-turn-helix domain-containing protein n=1 Tax=Arhodomonas sp. AD133 TaxID=3415009 RepID=UPI003EB8F9D5